MNSDVFLFARDIIRDRGWTQYKATEEDGSVCLEKAVHLACQAYDSGYAPFAALRIYCLERYRIPHPYQVNDTILTNEDEVCDLLEEIAKSDQKGGDDPHEGLRQF